MNDAELKAALGLALSFIDEEGWTYEHRNAVPIIAAHLVTFDEERAFLAADNKRLRELLQRAIVYLEEGGRSQAAARLREEAGR